MAKVNKKVPLRLVGLDGNAWVLLGAFRRAAERAGWDKGEIDAVLDAAMASDYDHLLATLAAHCEGVGFGECESEGGECD